MRQDGTARSAPRPEAGADAAGDAAAGDAGIRELLGRLAVSLASAADTRVQLAALEFAEERERARERLTLLLVAALATGFVLLGLNALVVALLWAQMGWVVIAMLVVLWAAVAGVAAWRLSLASHRDERPFSATLAEFARDRQWLAERFGKPRA